MKQCTTEVYQLKIFWHLNHICKTNRTGPSLAGNICTCVTLGNANVGTVSQTHWIGTSGTSNLPSQGFLKMDSMTVPLYWCNFPSLSPSMAFSPPSQSPQFALLSRVSQVLLSQEVCGGLAEMLTHLSYFIYNLNLMAKWPRVWEDELEYSLGAGA